MLAAIPDEILVHIIVPELPPSAQRAIACVCSRLEKTLPPATDLSVKLRALKELRGRVRWKIGPNVSCSLGERPHPHLRAAPGAGERARAAGPAPAPKATAPQPPRTRSVAAQRFLSVSTSQA